MNTRESGDVIFLVGAGASIPLGIPAMAGMFEDFMDKSKSSITTTEKKVCDLFVDGLGVAKDLEEFLLAANSIIESQGTALHKLNERISSPRMTGAGLSAYRRKYSVHIENVKKTKDSILKFMSDQCFCFDRDMAVEILEEFVKVVASKGYPVYTTNYDFAFEYTSEEIGLKLHDNFITHSRRQIWNTEIDFPLGSGLTLIKLHGSVSWYQDKNDEIEKHDLDVTRNTAGSRVNRLVVFPTRFKDIYSQNFFALYSHFLGALSSAKCLVVIGHSLRDEYLRAAIIEQIRLKNLTLIVVDPTWPRELRNGLKSSGTTRSKNIIHVPVAFEDFSDELTHMLATQPSENLGRKCSQTLNQITKRKNSLKFKGRLGLLKAGNNQEISVVTSGYAIKRLRPLYLKLWLEAKYQLPSGESKSEVSEFLGQEVKVGDGLSGYLDKELVVQFKTPSNESWLQHTNKVRLRAALVSTNLKKPDALNKNVILMEGYRDYSYK